MSPDGKFLGMVAQIDFGNVAVAITTLVAIAFAWLSNRSNISTQKFAVERAQNIENIYKIIDQITDFMWKCTILCSEIETRDPYSIDSLTQGESQEQRLSEDLSQISQIITVKLNVLDSSSHDLISAINKHYVAAQSGQLEKLSETNQGLIESLKRWVKKHNVDIKIN